MRMLGKFLLLLVAVLAVMAWFGGGITMAFVGFVSEYADSYTYKVGFKHPGDECGNNKVAFNVTGGGQLTCGFGGGRATLPGFTEAQSERLVQMAKELGADGLDASDRESIQGYVDRVVAAIPADQRPQHPWFYGWKVGVVGLIVAAPPTYVFFIRPRLKRPYRRARSYRGGAHQ
ncbi:hypothetical protein OG474_21845 [Kribbella sp. NBC_01505]|uniref:hypothetical protein n=1 Tax=Kribbella sp. NBC_01505 TaxID=2903580 RepID=UPI00386B2210